MTVKAVNTYIRWLEQYLAHIKCLINSPIMKSFLSSLRPPGEGARQYNAVVPAAAGGLPSVCVGLWGTEQQQRQSGRRGGSWEFSGPHGATHSLVSQRNVASVSHSLTVRASTQLFRTRSAFSLLSSGRPKRSRWTSRRLPPFQWAKSPPLQVGQRD